MESIDINKLLEKISEEMPCGESLEYDSALQALENSATVKPAQEFGDTVVPAEEPDWSKVKSQAIELLLRTKDLHIVATYLAPALIHTEGFPGCSQALSLIQGYLEQYWESVHPQLDPDDELDPIGRTNAISALSDVQTAVHSLRRAPLIQAQGIGIFSLRDIDIASGKISQRKDEEGEPPTQALIDGALMAYALDELTANAAAVTNAIGSIKQIRKQLLDFVGVDNTPQLKELSAELIHAQSILDKELSRRGVPEEAPKIKSDEGEMPATSTNKTTASLSGEINSRADVNNMLDKICDYYTCNEPSSPVPLLLKRAKRLISMNFMELVKDLASDGVSQAEKIMGADEKK